MCYRIIFKVEINHNNHHDNHPLGYLMLLNYGFPSSQPFVIGTTTQIGLSMLICSMLLAILPLAILGTNFLALIGEYHFCCCLYVC